ncbi:hypothetical protein ACWGNU_01945 [Paenibacillus lautus]
MSATSSIVNKKHFLKSDIGAQSAWKGFSSQTLYIASRIINDPNDYEFYPEDIEDLVIKKNGIVVEPIQIKNLTADLTLSALASTNSSQNGEGFFQRVCSLHDQNPDLSSVRVVYFNKLGDELQRFEKEEEDAKISLHKKLTDNHGLSSKNVDWLLSSLIFEKVDIEQMQLSIKKQISSYVTVMAAPDIAQSLLIQHVSDLSKSKGHISLKQWQEHMYKIGTDIAAFDGYFKEYQKALLRLCDLSLGGTTEQLKVEFEQGVSTHPSHIRHDLDLPRDAWLSKIANAVETSKAVIIKGVSGQGKTALCYRFLLNNYPEQLVFCVRSVSSIGQAENLAVALSGIAKHTDNMIIYIDVNPGDQQWVFLIQELQARGIAVPVLVSIREEDYNMTRLDGSTIRFEIIELCLSKQEAREIYERYTTNSPHPLFRSFDEAWGRFGGEGPLIEFAYLLTNTQTLKHRLRAQIENLLLEKNPDSWFTLLQLVSFVGQIGCPLNFFALKQEIGGGNLSAAVKRMSDEYLIRTSEDGQFIETLHPLRAQIISSILKTEIGEDGNSLMLSALKCMDSSYIQLFLMDFFSKFPYSEEIIQMIASIKCFNWIACAGIVRTLLWLDVKRYVEHNSETIDTLRKEHGSSWWSFFPMDISGLARPGELVVEMLTLSLPNINMEKVKQEVQKVTASLTSLHIDYEATDTYISKCILPSMIPLTDTEWSLFGYTLFWFAKRQRKVIVPFSIDKLTESMRIGDIQSKAYAIRGIYEQNGYDESCIQAIDILVKRMAKEFCFISFNVSVDETQCSFVPPLNDDTQNTSNKKNSNHYWITKVLNIFKELYPDKEYIQVELVGVDLLQDLGIQVFDNKVRVPKSNRHNLWITETNLWGMSRIDYEYRPDSWAQYVSKVDDIRQHSLRLIIDTIACFDHLYTKQYLDKKRWDKVVSGIDGLKKLLSLKQLLPKSVADPYCLYRENMNSFNEAANQQIEPYKPIVQLLSYNKYKSFIKAFSETYLHLETFFNQFADVLLARLRNEDIDKIGNPKLPLINLFESTKKLVTLQKEYNALFSSYSTLNADFDNQEVEGLIILLNMWAHVFKYPIKGVPIRYAAKEKYRKLKSVIERAVETAVGSTGGKSYVIDNTIYILTDFDPFSEITLESIYTRVVLQLRNSFKSAIPFNSERWYLETNTLQFVFVPLYKGIPFSSGFSIPLYRILNDHEENIATPMFPENLPVMLDSLLNLEFNELTQWKQAIGYLSTVWMLIKQYNDVILSIEESMISEIGLAQYIQLFSLQLSEALGNFSNSIKLPLVTLEKPSDEISDEIFGAIQNFVNNIELLVERVEKLERVDDLEIAVNNAVLAMMLLQPVVLTGIHLSGS